MRAQEAEEEGRELWGEVTALHSDVRTPLAPISESHPPCMPSPAGPPSEPETQACYVSDLVSLRVFLTISNYWVELP